MSLIDDIQDELTVLQKEFATKRGTMFLMNPMAASRMEQFANNTYVKGEMRKSQISNGKPKNRLADYNANALIQMDEIREMNLPADDDNDDELQNDPQSDSASNRKILSDAVPAKLAVVSAVKGNDNTNQRRSSRLSFIGSVGPSARISKTARRSQTMRSSIYHISRNQNLHQKAKGRGKMSIARASVFRTCEPAIALNGDGATREAEKEAVRRAKSIAHSLRNSRGSIFFNAMGR